MKFSVIRLVVLIAVIMIGCDTSIKHPSASTKIIVQNYYWAKPGMEEDVYQQRLLASSVREKYGHPVGRVMRNITENDSLPDIIWECEYPGMKAREQDVDRLTKNEEFSKVAEKMGELIKKFDRAIYEVRTTVKTIE